MLLNIKCNEFIQHLVSTAFMLHCRCKDKFFILAAIILSCTCCISFCCWPAASLMVLMLYTQLLSVVAETLLEAELCCDGVCCNSCDVFCRAGHGWRKAGLWTHKALLMMLLMWMAGVMPLTLAGCACPLHLMLASSERYGVCLGLHEDVTTVVACCEFLSAHASSLKHHEFIPTSVAQLQQKANHMPCCVHRKGHAAWIYFVLLQDVMHLCSHMLTQIVDLSVMLNASWHTHPAPVLESKYILTF